MQEAVAGPIRKLHEAKTLLWVQPFDDNTDRGPGGASTGALLNRDRVPKARGC